MKIAFIPQAETVVISDITISLNLYNVLVALAEESGQEIEDIVVGGIINSFPNDFLLRSPSTKHYRSLQGEK